VGVAARDVTFDVGCVAKALSMRLVFRRSFPCSAGKSRCAPVKLPLRRDMLEALEGRLAVDEFAHRPDECLKILKPAFDFGSRSGKNVGGSNSLFLVDLIHVVD
jgi:hypothetical protein